MRYIFAFIKLIILGVLITASIYQTGKLWFEETSDRNFFYDGGTAAGTVNTGITTGEDFIIPEQVGVYFVGSDIEYTVINSGANVYDSVHRASINIMKTVLDRGTYIGPLTSADQLWERQHIMMVLPFAYSGEELGEGFGLSASRFKEIDNVATVYIMPANEDKSVYMYLENMDDGILYLYKLNGEEVVISDGVLVHYLAEVLSEQENPSYISTLKNRLPFYGRTLLLPRVSQDSEDIRYHRNLYWEIPYVAEGTIDEDQVRQLVRPFFDNPDLLRVADFQDELRFIAENRSVTYSNQGVLEYSLVSDETGKTALAEAVALSGQFLEQIESVSAVEYYLSAYEETSEGIIIYYDIGFNGYPVVMTDESRLIYGMDHAAQVLVQGRQVITAKMLMRMIPERMPQFDVLDMPFEDALDQLFEAEGDLSAPIDKMYLAYSWKDGRSGMTLHWVISSDDRSYLIEVE